MAEYDSPRSVPAPGGGGIGLNDLLNVLWRWRWFIVLATLGGAAAGVVYGVVVTPLHRATATVQPGITTFSERGEPVREWRVRDIVQWYRRRDFNPTVAGMLGEDPREFQPIILASHIPQGPQQQGGLTITLSTLAPSREEAEGILRASIQAFNDFAEGDTLVSDINLVRVRIATDIEKLDAAIEDVRTRQKLLDLEMAAAREEIRRLRYRIESIKRDQAELREAASLMRQTREAFAAMVEAGGKGLGELRSTREQLEAELTGLRKTRDELLARDPQATGALMVQAAIADLSDQLGELQRSLPTYQDNVLSWRGSMREMSEDLAELQQQIEEQTRQVESDLPAAIATQERLVDELSLRREEELPREIDESRQEKRNLEARLASLRPLEAMGEPVSSARPVRPRKPRAILILTLLGLAGSVLGAFALDYLSRNWRDITHSRPT